MFIFLLMLPGFGFLCPGDGFGKDTHYIKFATVAPEGSTWIKKMRLLDNRLNEKSNGRIRLKIYAGGIAGDENDVLKKIRIGQIQCAAFSGAGISQILPMARILDLPFLFKNRKEMEAVQTELEDTFAEQFRSRGFEFLAWAEVGDVYLFSKKSIEKKTDLQGLRIWAWSGDPVAKTTFSAMGTNPIPISITEVTTALSTNMIDTFYAPPLGALALQWHHYIKYMAPFPIAHATAVVLISSDFFNNIPKDLAKLFKSDIRYAMADLTSELIIQEQEAIDVIQQSGVTVTPMPSEQELEEFHRIHHRVASELTGVVYPKELLDRVYEILDRTRKTK